MLRLMGLDFHRTYLEIVEKIVGGPTRASMRSYSELGFEYQGIEQYQKAIDCFQKQLAIAEALAMNQGGGRAYLEQYQLAIDCFGKDLLIDENVGATRWVSSARENLGKLYYKTDQHEKSIERFRVQMEIAEELGDKNQLRHAHENMGLVYEDIRQNQLAIDCFNKQLLIDEELGYRRGICNARRRLGRVYYKTDQYQKSIECLLVQMEIAEELGDKIQLSHVYEIMGHAYVQTRQYHLAIESYNKQMQLADEQGSKRGVGEARANLGIAYCKAGQYQKSVDCLLVQLTIAKELRDKEEEGSAYKNLGYTYKDMGHYKKAYDYHQKHLKISEDLGNKEDIGKAYGNMGKACEENAQYQQAIGCYEKELQICEEVENKEGVEQAYFHLGSVYRSIGKYEEAIDCHRKQLEIDREIGDTRVVGRAYGRMGDVYSRMGQHCEAIDCHRKHLEIADRLGDNAEAGDAYGSIGCAYNRIGQYKEAMEWNRKSIKIAQELGNKRDEGRGLSRLADDHDCIGEYQKAIDYNLKSLEIAKAVNDWQIVGVVHGHVGNSYLSMGRCRKAIEYHSRCLEIAQELGDREGERMAYGNIGNVYVTIGQYRKAMESFDKHRNICKHLGDREGVGRNYTNIGNIYSIRRQYQKAIDYYLKSLEIATELGEKGIAGAVHGNIGHAYNGLGEYQTAMEHICKSLDVANELGDRSGVGIGYCNMGGAYRCTGQRDKAIDSYRRSLKIAQETGSDISVAIAQAGLGLCYEGDDDHLACSYFARSILGHHTVRNPLTQNDEFNTSISDKFAGNYKHLMQCLLNLNQVKLALLVSDSGKAKALYDLTRRTADAILDSVQEKNITTPVQAIVDDPTLKASEALLDVVLSKLINEMLDGSIISYTFSLDGRLHAWVISRGGVFFKQWQPVNGMSAKTYLTTVGERLLDTVVVRNPQSDSFYLDEYDENLEDQINSVANERESRHLKVTFSKDLEKRVQRLTRNDAVREKQVREEHAVEYDSVKKRYNLDQPTSRHGGFGKRNDDDENQKKLFGQYFLDRPRAIQRKQLHRGENKTQPDSTTATYLKKQYSIFISPIEEYLVGSKLLVVPETSLFRVPFCAFLNSKNEHLCDRFSLQFTPSLHVLDSCLSRPLPTLGPALFVGNPTVGEVKFGDKVGSVSSLPNATVEARECGKYFNAEPLLEENASKENVLKKLKDASVVHIAAHGHMDHADIFLAPNEGAPKPPSEEDYLLTAKDIVDCTLKARLVVLSCCHSGRGQISAEGVVGIARSFLGAGARSVLVTLWQIPDKPTMEFMVLFYERICQGVSICLALQQVMLELKKKYTMKAWAPFQIVGEDVVLTQDDIEEIRRQSRVA